MSNLNRLFMTDDQAVGGARRDRTADPLLAKQMLSQLSYGPGNSFASSRTVNHFSWNKAKPTDV